MASLFFRGKDYWLYCPVLPGQITWILCLCFSTISFFGSIVIFFKTFFPLFLPCTSCCPHYCSVLCCRLYILVTFIISLLFLFTTMLVLHCLWSHARLSNDVQYKKHTKSFISSVHRSVCGCEHDYMKPQACMRVRKMFMFVWGRQQMSSLSKETKCYSTLSFIHYFSVLVLGIELTT